MRNVFLSVALGIAGAASTACAGLDTALGPSGSASNLIGSWISSSSVGSGLNSCTNLQWQVTGQQGGTIVGQASAVCGSMSISGTVSGTVNGNDVPYQITGTASVPGIASCPFSISGTARLEGEAIRVPYSGTTCLGPAQGEEVLRKPAQPTPAPTPTPTPTPTPSSPPPPDPTPAPTVSPFHVGPGPLAGWRAEQVVNATADEYAYLLSPRPSDGEAVAAAAELLRRMIWHLQLAGFQAGRQRNPSGAISNDKMTIFYDGAWHAHDVFRDVGVAGQTTVVIFLEVFSPNTVADGGIPD